MRRHRKALKDPERLGNQVHGVMSDLGYDMATPGLLLARKWAEIVGEQAAEHCEPVELHGEQLEVLADSSVWSQYLQLHREEILARITEHLSQDAPKRIRFRVG